ncbi:hypothetical protein DW953_15630 [Ruminococcus sp. AM45-2]|nr:hypothetical protein DW953_15630 [Ruminococcus sp. AM45-2]
MPFQRRLFGLACWLGRFAGVCATGTRSPLGEPSERKTCLQVAFLMGVPVKSAFALLLTKVTKPENVEIYRWEMKKCRER